MSLINTAEDLARAADDLGAREPRFARAYALTGPLPLRRRESGFAAMLDIICSQQLSVASADAVLGRLRAAGATDPDRIGTLDDADLRACGLSRQKIAYTRALAEARLDWAALESLPESEAIARLVAVKGIGTWSAEIYLMFCVGRADVFAPGDLALQEAARLLFELPERPTEKALRAQAAAWSPWRAVAARLLWAYYRHAKNRPGVSE